MRSNHRVWAFLLVTVGVFGLWVAFGPYSLSDNAGIGLIVGAIFVLPTVGTFWMLYRSIRYEEQPLPFVFLAFIPYAFVWYYFAHASRSSR
ncbi:MAG TPA: hypothetical protein VFL79_07780 [Terriglobia bacterium]|nr:hypothetical protein [Terriglobia bacterium]